jgi:hypothetical protein
MTKTAKIAVAILIIAVIVALVSYIQATQQPLQPPKPSPTPTASPTPTPSESTPTPTSVQSPTPSSEEQIRDSIMSYIKTNHPETTQFMNDLDWTGGRATPGNIVGSEKYMYYAGGWNFTMSYPVVPQPIYTITADYKATDIGVPYRIIWEGTWQNQVTNETHYVFAQ